MAPRRPRTKNTDEIEKVAARIMSVNDVSPFVKVLVFGANGSGKTRFAASAPKCLIIDINEEGTRSAVGTDAEVFPCRTWEDIGHIYWYLKGGDHEYESVAIDTITAMQALAMSFVLDEAEERDPSREKRSPDKRSYGRAGTLVQSMVWAFRNLDMHVIFTAQVRRIIDDDTGELLDITVDLPAGSRGSATGAVSVLGYMQPREVRVRSKKTGKIEKRWIDTMAVGPSLDYSVLKDRTHQLGPVLKKPTMDRVIEAWLNTDHTEE